MNTEKFIDALDEQEKEELLICLSAWEKNEMRKKVAEKIVLTKEEKSLVKSLKIVAAIKSIWNREKCTLQEAKIAVDMFRETF